MNKEKSINNFSIVAFILSFILFPVGLILSIIGLVRCNKYKKENGKNPRYYAFNIVGLVVSIISFLITLFIFGIIILVFGILASNEKYVEGNYTCYYPNSYRPAVSAEFNNGNFRWSKYLDEKNNSIEGTYRLNAVSINNNDYTYKLRIRPKTIKTTTHVGSKKYYDIVIEKVNNRITITFDNGTKYNCTKRINNNEF